MRGHPIPVAVVIREIAKACAGVEEQVLFPLVESVSSSSTRAGLETDHLPLVRPASLPREPSGISGVRLPAPHRICCRMVNSSGVDASRTLQTLRADHGQRVIRDRKLLHRTAAVRAG